MEIATELADLLRSVAEEHGVPGASAGVLVDGEVHAVGIGTTSVEHPQAVDPGTLFQVGSVSKTFTSAAVMQLVEAGSVDLDDPVARHLPDLGPATGLDTEAITVEHLLSHQAGFDGDHLFTSRRADDLTELADARRFFEPGAGVSYSNAGFSIAGAVIEAVAGEAFEDVVGRRLLRPLGMRTAGFRADAVITNKVAMPHLTLDDETFVLRGGGWQRGWELGRLDRAAGGLIASVDHLLRWCTFQLDGLADDGTALLSAESLERLHTPVVEVTPTERIGLDWFVEEIDGTTVIAHGGETPGYLTDLTLVPEQAVGVVSTTNAVNGSPVTRAVRRWALDRFAGLTETDPEVDPTIAVDLDRLTGRYLHAFGWIDVTHADEPDHLRVEVTPRDDVAWQPPAQAPATIAPYGPRDLRSVDLGDNVRTYRFGLDEDGSPAAWIQPGYRRAPRVD
jgi:CubicO group peptidase (beta-lactamase class C family)